MCPLLLKGQGKKYIWIGRGLFHPTERNGELMLGKQINTLAFLNCSITTIKGAFIGILLRVCKCLKSMFLLFG